jgi:hypothetical protein
MAAGSDSWLQGVIHGCRIISEKMKKQESTDTDYRIVKMFLLYALFKNGIGK